MTFVTLTFNFTFFKYDINAHSIISQEKKEGEVNEPYDNNSTIDLAIILLHIPYT